MRVLGSPALASTLRPERRRECVGACQPPLHREVGGQILQSRPAVGHAAPATCPPKMPNTQRNVAFQRTRAPGLLPSQGSVPASSPCPRPSPAELLGSCGLRRHAGLQSPPCQLGRGSAASKRNGARRSRGAAATHSAVGDVRDSRKQAVVLKQFLRQLVRDERTAPNQAASSTGGSSPALFQARVLPRCTRMFACLRRASRTMWNWFAVCSGWHEMWSYAPTPSTLSTVVRGSRSVAARTNRCNVSAPAFVLSIAERILERGARSLELVSVLLCECARNHPPEGVAHHQSSHAARVWRRAGMIAAGTCPETSLWAWVNSCAQSSSSSSTRRCSPVHPGSRSGSLPCFAGIGDEPIPA